MNMPKTFTRILFVMLFLVLISGGQVLAQTSSTTQQASQADKNDETNLETQLYLLVATNQGTEDAKMPASLDSVIRQLHASLPLNNYRLAATLINRVKNEGQLSLRWQMTASVAAPSGTLTPTFNEFRLNGVKLMQGASGQQLVRVDGFAFGTRVPIQTGMQGTSGTFNGQATPTINYESAGLNTAFSMREGEAVIVGTLNLGTSGDATILVMSVRRTLK
ncbi:MAG TPA: hypothetical protein DC047_06700 [Blastocatellia bacterium]|nr:hypothetical protein [Blastocatellia bacterium]